MCCAYLYNIKRDSNCFTSTANVSHQRRPRGRAGCEFSDGRDLSFGGRVEHTNKSVVHVSISETDHRHDFFGLNDFATLGDFNCFCQSPTSRRLFYEKELESDAITAQHHYCKVWSSSGCLQKSFCQTRETEKGIIQGRLPTSYLRAEKLLSSILPRASQQILPYLATAGELILVV